VIVKAMQELYAAVEHRGDRAMGEIAVERREHPAGRNKYGT
jgi:hypothetical protein